MAYVLRRVAISIGLIWTVATLIFLVLRMIPGDPAELLLSSGGVAPDPAQVLELRERLGLEAPILEQYAAFIGQLLRLDLGTSLTDDYPVLDEIAKRLPRTLELILAATVLAVALGMPLGVMAALQEDPAMAANWTGWFGIAGQWLPHWEPVPEGAEFMGARLGAGSSGK